MKPVCTLLLLFLLSASNLFGKIRNGYEAQLYSCKLSLHGLNMELLNRPDLTRDKRLRIESKIDYLIDFISYYELTEELIRQLRMVSPGIYLEIDSLIDRRGRPTDVYVRVMPREKLRTQMKAASFVTRSSIDEDASVSEYGEHSVAVDIGISDNALFLLSHEFGHINYIVPNLAAYSEFYDKHYVKPRVKSDFIGHKPHDESGKCANVFEQRFIEEKARYRFHGGIKPESPYILVNRIRKNVRATEGAHPLPTIAAHVIF